MTAVQILPTSNAQRQHPQALCLFFDLAFFFAITTESSFLDDDTSIAVCHRVMRAFCEQTGTFENHDVIKRLNESRIIRKNGNRQHFANFSLTDCDMNKTMATPWDCIGHDFRAFLHACGCTELRGKTGHALKFPHPLEGNRRMSRAQRRLLLLRKE